MATVVSKATEDQKQESTQRSNNPRRVQIKDTTLLGVASFIFYIVVGLYLVLHLHYYSPDNGSRVANAYYVLFSRDPHLGAIGFIWNPLPSVFELPFVALHPIWPGLVSKGIAGIIVSAVFGSIGVVALVRILAGFNVPKVWRISITIIFALNPLVILYAANGMSDLMLVSCILATYSGILDFLYNASLRRLSAAAFWMAIAFGIRYEAVPFGAFIIGGMVIGLWGRVKHVQWAGIAVILGAPLVFAGGIWLYFNWLIMKDPLYFLDSSYGNLAQTRTGTYVTHSTAMAEHSVVGTLLYVAHFTLLFWPIDIGIVLTAFFVFGRLRDPRAPILLGGMLGAITLEIVFLYKGSLASWDRFFISFIPDGILLCAFAFSKIAEHQKALYKHIIWFLAVLLFLSGDVGTFMALQTPALGRPDGYVVDAALAGRNLRNDNDMFATSAPILAYLDDHPHLTVLADTYLTWPIVVRSPYLNQFVIASDYDFHSILYNPRGRVDAFLIPEPVGLGQLDAVNRAWPSMWAGHVSWAKLIMSFPGGYHFRLYAVTPAAP